jgi:hypothetical protein
MTRLTQHRHGAHRRSAEQFKAESHPPISIVEIIARLRAEMPCGSSSGFDFHPRSWDLAQAARSPGQAAACATRAARTTHAATDPDSTESAATAPATTSAAKEPATAATSAAAAPAATPAAAAPTTTSAAAATAASAGDLHAAAGAFPIEEMERGEADVSHFLFAKNEALIGRGVIRLRDIGSWHRGCGCATDQRKTQSGGTKCHHGGGFGCALLLRSLLHSWHGRILRKFVKGFNLTWQVCLCAYKCIFVLRSAMQGIRFPLTGKNTAQWG